MPRFLVVIERAPAAFSAYCPDLPGCVSTGATPDETVTNMRTAIELHVEGLIEDGQPIPEPTTTAAYVEVP